jgi:putative SOS response-associated peptidase YedK
MCGRVKQVAELREIRVQFKVPRSGVNLPPRWNGAPTNDFAIVRHDVKAGERVLESMRWGLVPFWAKDEKIGFSTINAMAETVATKPAFRDAWKRGQRCVVPLDGFYEWEKLSGGKKQPYAVTRADGKFLAVAGLWEAKKLPDDSRLRTFTILTCAPNEKLARLHNRMPVVLDDADLPVWLGEAPTTPESLDALMRPCPDDWLALTPVDPRMGNVKNEAAEFCQPITIEAA